MRYKMQERVQKESYCCTVSLLEDVVNTLFDEELCNECVHIITDKHMTEKLVKNICQLTINDFTFNLTYVNFDSLDDSIDEYRITIYNNGKVYVSSAIDENAEYYSCDGFLFVEYEVSEDVYRGNNRNCDTIVFDICD